MKGKRISLLVMGILLCLSLIAGCSTEQKNDIIILFTNDVHCGIEENIGYAGLTAYKKSQEKKTPYVTLVDVGDAIQGDFIGTISKGQYIVDIMNEADYDLAILGNHEFDYGMDQLKALIDQSEATYLAVNLTYSGNQENALEAVKPYEIINYGQIDVGYIGVATPESKTSSTPAYFMEDGEFVYGFTEGNNGQNLYDLVQNTIDEVREKGAEYVVVLAHLGIDENSSPFTSYELIQNTEGIDVLLDGHSHSVISSRVEQDKSGEDVLICSTGTKLDNIGQVVISANGHVSTGLISDYNQKDETMASFVNGLQEIYEEEMNEVIAVSDTALSGYTEDGIRLVRNRETAIGNFCADAYRAFAGAQIALVNGGGIRDDLPEGDITYADMLAIHPFGNYLCMVEATGQEILDSLEIASRDTRAEIQEDGYASGENGSFQSVSGLKYTINTSIASSVVFDENGMFVSVDGPRRIEEVYVLDEQGEYQPIDPNGIYTVVSHNYLIKESGGGINVFADNELLIDQSISDYQVLTTYIVDTLEGHLGDKYSQTEGRITVK